VWLMWPYMALSGLVAPRRLAAGRYEIN
jgi:hypothetical protein